MPVERAAGSTSLIDVLDRVLDKGIVIDEFVRVSLAGVDLITVEARVVVVSIDTYLKYSEAISPSRLTQPSESDLPVDLPPRASPADDEDEDDGGGNTPSGSGGAPAFAGVAQILPRKPPSSRHRTRKE